MNGLSRRRFLFSIANGQPTPAPTPGGPWTRISLTDPGAKAMLDSYATAITALLKLSPTDARNFYRNAFIHTLDCPHGNWWFLPWHRGYLGWWEQTVRQFSKNQNFAFPYWDWTAQPFVPDAFWNGVLNPASSAFISSVRTFQNTFRNAINTFYRGLTTAQKGQLAVRPGIPGFPNMNTVQGFWANTLPDFAQPARDITQSNPDIDPVKPVELDTIEQALATPYFSAGGPNPPGGFGSDPASQHSQSSTKGILESEPHDNVHGDIGGFMGAFLSPVDPIFMAHHANIDRLWSVWTGQQEAAGQPTLPTVGLADWKKEPFLFYIDSQGKPVTTKTTAGDYATISDFNYTYTQGSGATSAAARESSSRGVTNARRVSGTIRTGDMTLTRSAVADVSLPALTLRTARTGLQHVRAHITIVPPPDPRNVRFHVFVNPPENEFALDPSHPSYAGTLQFFGRMPHPHPVTFTIGLEDTIEALRNARMLSDTGALQIHIVPQTRGVALRDLPQATVSAIEISTF